MTNNGKSSVFRVCVCARARVCVHVCECLSASLSVHSVCPSVSQESICVMKKVVYLCCVQVHYAGLDTVLRYENLVLNTKIGWSAS